MFPAPSDPVHLAPAHAGPSRRCWRCLQTFACEPDEVLPGPPVWWLCESCHAALIPGSGSR